MNAGLQPSRALAALVAGTGFADLPPATVRAAQRALLDAVGVSLAAAKVGEGCAAFTELAMAQGGAPESTLIGTRDCARGPIRVPASLAAFANGALAHALDFEDAHDDALVHPNAATLPAALAVAEQTGADGARTLTALVVGCEVVCRLGLALEVALDDFGWYPPPILGAFGAAAAAASLYGLDADGVRDAFSLILCQATCSAELKHSPRSLIRGVRDAFPASAGVVAAQLAARGVTGFERPLEGQAGFFAAFARGRYDPQPLCAGVSQGFEIERLSFKPWPSCRGTHVFVEAALTLAAEAGLSSDDISEVRVVGHRVNRMLAEPAGSKRRPATAIDARFSIPFTVASALVHGRLALEHFHAEALRNPRVLELAGRVHFRTTHDADPALTDLTAGTTEIRTRDGRTFSRHLDRACGHPSRPLSDADLEDKFRCCAGAGGLAPDQAETIIAAVAGLPAAADVRTLTALL